MDLKKILKNLKLNESTISMVLGAVVIIVVGSLVVNYFRDLDQGTTLPSVETQNGTEESGLNKTHIVREGDDLWNIAELYYNDGYKWVDIAEANDIENPNSIEKGQRLTIPALTELTDTEETQEDSMLAMDEDIDTFVAKEIVEDQVMSESDEDYKDESKTTQTEPAMAIKGEKYTVVKGDNLWNIAERAYGDGFRWVDIAKANELVNPSLIHSGNEFEIPR